MENSDNGMHEHSFNLELAKALRGCNPAWRQPGVVRAERTGRGKRPDIAIQDDTMARPVLVECAYDGDKRKDAHKRLHQTEFADVDTVFAVCVPSEVFGELSETETLAKLRAGATVGYALVQRAGDGLYEFPPRGYLLGNVRDLAGFIQVAAVPKDKVEAVADAVAAAILTAAKMLANNLTENAQDEIAGLMSQREQFGGVQTAVLLWLDALLVQQRIAQHKNNRIHRLPFKSSDTVLPSVVYQSWRKILAVNWKSIFAPAMRALGIATDENPRVTSWALGLLLGAVERIDTARLGRRINVGAELFPKISDDRKTAAAFYTLPATAELLAALTIRESDRDDWRAPNLFNQLNIADFACGTGTLLRAALHRITHFHNAAGGNVKSLIALHRKAMESGLVGADVSPIAAHLTVSSLAMQGAGRRYDHAQIGFVRVGFAKQNGGDAKQTSDEKSVVKTGALEFLSRGRIVNDLVSGGSEYVLNGNGDGEADEIAIKADDDAFDYVIMNPPYSRTRGGQSAFDIAGIKRPEMLACQKRWAELNKTLPANKQAGMAASFLCLAAQKLKPGGRLGLVLPLTAAFGASWDETRAMIVTEFEDIIALTPANAMVGGASNLSADTGMGEMLLMATKRARESQELSSVLCVMPERMPLKVGEADEYGRCIQRAISVMAESDTGSIRAGKSELGRAIRFVAKQPTDPWSHLGVRNVELANIALLLTNGEMQSITTQKSARVDCEIVQLQNLFEIGPNESMIGRKPGSESPRGAFILYPVTDAADAVGRDRVLWDSDANAQTTLRVLPTHKGVVRDKTMHKHIADKRGYLHCAMSVGWTSQKLVAATTQYPAFGGGGGNAWVTLLSEDKYLCKAFALWANSTFGAMVYWTQGGRQQRARATLSMVSVRQIPVPDLRQLPAKRLTAAAKFFDAIADQELLPVGQLCLDKLRQQIDKAVAEMVGLPYNEAAMHELRAAFCAEPSVHGNSPGVVEKLRAAGITGA